MSKMSLPKFMVMKSNVSGKYLCYGKGNGSTLSSLTFSHEMKRPNLNAPSESFEFTSSEKTSMEFYLLKFEVQEAKNAPGFFHIRTSYNNKYLVRKSEDSNTIVAEAHEEEEDQSKWSCTLFKPIFIGEAEAKAEDDNDDLFGSNKIQQELGIGTLPQKIQLMHVVSQDYVYVDTATESIKLTSDAAVPTTLTVFNVEPTAILPQHFAFRGHDGNYIGTPNGSDLWFRYSDIGSSGVAMVTLNWNISVPTRVVLKPKKYDICYWMVNGNSDVGLTGGGYTWLYPIRVNNYVVLYATDNNRFISRKHDNGVTAVNRTITNESMLEVVEPVLSRTILSVIYDLKNARVYGTTSVTKITDSRSNFTNEVETGSLVKDYTMSRTMSWNQSMTVSVGMSMSMSFGVPTVGIGGEIGVTFDISETCEWGEEKTHEEKVTHKYDFNVPPMTKQTKTVVATRSSCDVPFTCEVVDAMTDGTTRRYTKTDCWFRGANDYTANQETRNEPLT